jgi:hypothetical protein
LYQEKFGNPGPTYGNQISLSNLSNHWIWHQWVSVAISGKGGVPAAEAGNSAIAPDKILEENILQFFHA